MPGPVAPQPIVHGSPPVPIGIGFDHPVPAQARAAFELPDKREPLGANAACPSVWRASGDGIDRLVQRFYLGLPEPAPQ